MSIWFFCLLLNKIIKKTNHLVLKWQRIHRYDKYKIFDQYFDFDQYFSPKVRYLTNIWIFDQKLNFDFWVKFRFLGEIYLNTGK